MMRLGPAVVLAALVLLAILMPLPGAFGSPAGLAARWRWPRWASASAWAGLIC